MRPALLLALSFVACGGSSEEGGGAKAMTLPAELKNCVPEGSPGNSKEIGKYCSKGGGQCNFFSYARFCTVDFEPNAPGFCTNSCSVDADCGEDAVCTSKEAGGQKGCTPVACMAQPKTAASTTPQPTSSPDAGMSGECAALERCCADPMFPSKWLTVCQESTKGNDEFCHLARRTYEIAGDCAKQN